MMVKTSVAPPLLGSTSVELQLQLPIILPGALAPSTTRTFKYALILEFLLE